MKHYMIDIETLSIQDDAVIIAAGVVYFEGKIITSELFGFNPINQLLTRHICPDTKAWWKDKQPLFKELTDMNLCLNSFLHYLVEELKDEKEFTIWAKDPDFDLRILEHAFSQNNIPIPWKYYQKGSVRTAYAKLKQKEIELVKPTRSHNPESDAISQAINVIKFLGV